jgi:hypothetical protein
MPACQDVWQIFQKSLVGGTLAPGFCEIFRSHGTFAIGETVGFYPIEVYWINI